MTPIFMSFLLATRTREHPASMVQTPARRPPRTGDAPVGRARDNRGMSNTDALAVFSDALADLAEAGGASVVQVLGARRPATGVAHGADTVLTTARAIGREDGLRVRVAGADPIDADLVGWDPATGLAVLRTRTPIAARVPAVADAEPRVGQLVLALARSWSNALTASAGIVAVVGGPLRTGRRREIARVIRVTAPMHDGFAGGAVFDAAGRLTGVATASAIRGLGVVIPASIAWAAASQVVTAGSPRRGFVGLAVQAVPLSQTQQLDGREHALLVMAITPGSPADAAGLIVGDVLLDFDGRTTASTDDLLDALSHARIGQPAPARILRGGAVKDVTVTVAERQRD
jgi:serine protease Do